MDKGFAQKLIELYRSGATQGQASHEIGLGSSSIERYYTFLDFHGEEEFIDFWVYKKRVRFSDEEYTGFAAFALAHEMGAERGALLFKTSRQRFSAHYNALVNGTPLVSVVEPIQPSEEVMRRIVSLNIPLRTRQVSDDVAEASHKIARGVDFKNITRVDDLKITPDRLNRSHSPYKRAKDYLDQDKMHARLFDNNSEGFEKLPFKAQAYSIRSISRDQNEYTMCLKRLRSTELEQKAKDGLVKFHECSFLKSEYPMFRHRNIMRAVGISAALYSYYHNKHNDETRYTDAIEIIKNVIIEKNQSVNLSKLTRILRDKHKLFYGEALIKILKQQAMDELKKDGFVLNTPKRFNHKEAIAVNS